MVSAFSGSESDPSFLISSLEKCSSSTMTGISKPQTSESEMISPQSANPFQDDYGTPIRKLVLVDSIIQGGDGDKSLEKDGSNNNCSLPENDGSSKEPRTLHPDGEFKKMTAHLEKITQQLDVVINRGLLMPPMQANPELAKLVEGVISEKLERKFDDMYAMMYNMHNYFMVPKIMPPTSAPPSQQITIKTKPQEPEYTREDADAMDQYRHQDNIFHTPKKLTKQSGLALSPETNQDQNHPTTIPVPKDSGFDCNFPIEKRSLTFPKSLVRILDGKSDEHISKNGEGAMQIDEDNGISSKALLVKVEIKEEPQDEPSGSPFSDIKFNLGLLALADVALKQRSEETNSLPESEGWPSSSDSGRSTGDSFPVGSTPTDQASDDAHSQQQVECNSSKYSSQDSRDIIILPRPPNSELSSTSTEPVVVERKTRKRRKTKAPLPCEFCGKIFNNQSSLRQHESFHRPMRPYKCSEEKCEKAYKTRSELNRHLVVHSGEKKHFCKLCGKRFLRKQYLKTHLIRHHETGITMVTPARRDENGEIEAPIVTVASSSFVSKAEPLTWRCQLCFKIFVNNEDLNKHIRSYHEKKRSEKLKL